jgi:dihydropteroate synthase
VAWGQRRSPASGKVRLIEPLGLLHGWGARDAVVAGLAVPLAGGPAAFSLVRLHEAPPVPSGETAAVRGIETIPADWSDQLARITTAPPPWAGLPTDRPLVMGILNVTPDSFSDGGDHAGIEAALAHSKRMIAEGADLIDVGGESTRPGAAEVPAPVEQKRVLPVVRALAAEGIVVSIDTRHAATMRAALDAGARIVNDVSGLAFDPKAATLMRQETCPVVIQHMRGTPETMARLARYQDAAAETTRELAARIEAAGIERGRVLVDPGIGFAKLQHHNLELLARLPILLNLGCRVLVGASRKSFLGAAAGEPKPSARVPGSLAAGLAAVLGGAAVLRVHDVAATVQALRVWQGIYRTA